MADLGASSLQEHFAPESLGKINYEHLLVRDLGPFNFFFGFERLLQT